LKKDFNVGDQVHVKIRKKDVFGKELEQWSDKIYIIIEDNVKSFKVDGLCRYIKHYELQKVKTVEDNPFEEHKPMTTKKATKQVVTPR